MVLKAMDAVRETIPNYVCDQITFRFGGEGRTAPQWKVLDRVTNEMLWVDGKESYRDVKVKGKLLAKLGSPDKSGTWSTGDWHSIQFDVVEPNSAAVFEFKEDTTMAGRKARRYTYRVRQPNSHWKLVYQGYMIYPNYRGDIWIDDLTNRILRLEMQAFDMPADYPLDVAEMTVENGKVRIGEEDYLLPVQAAALACERRGDGCTKNEIEFRNYRKFTAESTVVTADSTITFDGVPKVKKAAGRKK